MKFNSNKIIVVAALAFCSCTFSKKAQQNEKIAGLKLIGTYSVPHNKVFGNTVIGGLSGIDYYPKKDDYYLISDDRSDNNPARFYTAKIRFNQHKIDTVAFTGVTFLKNELGNFYPNSGEDPYRVPDPEALRYNEKNNSFVWSSEGERIVNCQKPILENPAITEISVTGNYKDTFQLPPQLLMKPTENGPRQNGVFEGLTFRRQFQNIVCKR